LARLRKLGTLLPIILLANLNGILLRAQSDTDAQPDSHAPTGFEVAILNHLQDGQELKMPRNVQNSDLIDNPWPEASRLTLVIMSFEDADSPRPNAPLANVRGRVDEPTATIRY
jgi:hypothetical protein